MRQAAAILVLSVLTAGCDSSPGITTLAPTTTTLAPVPFGSDSIFVTAYPAMGGISSRPPLSIAYSNGLWIALGGVSARWDHQLWSSTDGVVWETLEPPELAGSAHRAILSTENGWVLFSNRGGEPPVRVWLSVDGLEWIDSGTELDLVSGSGPYDYAAAGNSITILMAKGYGFGSDTGPAEAFYSRDTGSTWERVPTNGEPMVVAEVSGDLIVGGTSAQTPTLWRLSTGWTPESVTGLGDAQSVQGLVQMPDGSIVLQGSERNRLTKTWFVSSDLRDWEEVAPPKGLVDRVSLSRRGPFVVASLFESDWVSTDGVNWVEVGAAELRPDPAFRWSGPSISYASDGTSLIGANWLGLVSDHELLLTGPEYPGAWEELVRLSGYMQVWGSGSQRYLVRGGRIEVFKEGTLVPLPDPPVPFHDSSTVSVTESALFVESQGETWVFREGEWQSANLPALQGRTEVVERGGRFIVMSIDNGEVQRYLSDGGIRWKSAPTEPVAADAIWVDVYGWFVASLEWEASRTGDGSEWVPIETGVQLQRPEPVDGILVVPMADGDLSFPMPTEIEFRGVTDWSNEAVSLHVERDGVPYLVVVLANAETIWAPRQYDDPVIWEAWFDGTTLYGVRVPSGEQIIYVWNPDAE